MMFEKRGIESFLNPRSIVVIGASNKPGKVGYALARNLLSFKGKVFFVNKESESIFGISSFSSVSEIKERIELAIIAIPASAVPLVLDECGKKGIKSIIIISAGFGESGNKELEEEITVIKKKHNLRILGPNCFGVVNTDLFLDATFAKTHPSKGAIAFISQSGALWSGLADLSQSSFVGFSKVITLGDRMDVDFAECIEHLEKDAHTNVMLLYLESLIDGKEFMRVVKKCKKPIIILKAGKTDAGMKAALSHTGSLAGSFEVYKAAFKQCGAMSVDTLTEGIDLAHFLSIQSKPRGKRVLVVTNAGGPGILAADALVERGLEVPLVSRRLRWNNPIDVLGDADADRYKVVFNKLSKESFFDSTLVMFTPQMMANAENVAKEIVLFFKKSKRPLVACFLGAKTIEGAKRILEENNIPCFDDINRAVKVL
ncbi:MAG: CoA-binding protein [Candidatus Nanoarchaeia archaeon]